MKLTQQHANLVEAQNARTFAVKMPDAVLEWLVQEARRAAAASVGNNPQRFRSASIAAKIYHEEVVLRRYQKDMSKRFRPAPGTCQSMPLNPQSEQQQ